MAIEQTLLQEPPEDLQSDFVALLTAAIVTIWTPNWFLNFPAAYFGPQGPQVAVPQPFIGPQGLHLPVPPPIIGPLSP